MANTSCRRLKFFVVFIIIVVLPRSDCSNGSLDVLGEINNHNLHYDIHGITQSDIFRYYLWDRYRLAPRLERPEVLKDLSQIFTRIAYLDHTIDMVAIFLFGPQNAQSILRSDRDYTIQPLPHESQCFESTFKLFRKHCGELTEHGLKHIQSFENMCTHALEMADIKEALLVTCGMNIGPSVIDVGHPTIDVTPAPLRGSSYFCERVSVHGISRMKLQSYATAYRILLVPAFLIPDSLYDQIHVCFHRDASLGLCDCKKDDWTSFKRSSGLKSRDMSPYQQNFVDVRFDSGVYGYVTLTLDEVSRRGLYQLLVAGICLLFMAPYFAKNIFTDDVNIRVDIFFKWTLRVVGVTWISLSSTDRVLGMVAVGFCIALYYVISCIKVPVLSKMMKLWQWSVGQGPVKESIRSQDDFCSTFHGIPKRKNFSKKELEHFSKELTNESVSKLVSSPEYIKWVLGKKEDLELDHIVMLRSKRWSGRQSYFYQMANWMGRQL